MPTIRNNIPTTIAIHFMRDNQAKQIVFQPGVNIGVDQKDLDALHNHPIFKAMYVDETLEVLLKAPTDTSNLEGFEVVERKRDDQPIPVLPVKYSETPDLVRKEARLNLTKTELLELPGIGDGYASKIIANMPEGGYSSFGELKEKNAELKKISEDGWAEIREALGK